MQKIKRYLRQCIQLRVLALAALTLLWAANALWMPDGFLRASFSVAFLSLVPGYVLFRAIAGYKTIETTTKILGYSVGLGLVLLMIIGLTVNQVLPLIGHSQPLTTHVLTAAVGAVTMLLVFVSAARIKTKSLSQQLHFAQVKLQLKRLADWRRILLICSLLLLPILAVGGAITLNNGGNGWLALAVVGLIAATFLVFAWANKTKLIGLYPFVLYVLCLAILLGTSMRGWDITGHDIMQEFQVFQLTIQHAFWSMQQYPDAYTACLSITILPTIFQKLTGIADPFIFKLIFQMLFALIAPIIYTTLRSYVPRKIAFLAAFVCITFPTFLTDMMMLNRQEIALLCLALGLLAVLDKHLYRLQRAVLAIIFLGGMVLSHYSTSYIALSVLLVVLIIGGLLHVLRPWLVKRHVVFAKYAHFSLFPPYVAIAVLAVIICWNGLFTHTANNITKTLGTISSYVVGIVHPSNTTSPPPTAETNASSLQRYVDYTSKNLPLPADNYYSAAATAPYAPAEVVQPPTGKTPLMGVLHVPASALETIYGLSRQAYIGLVGGLILLGLLLMMLKAKAGPQLPNQYILLGIASVLVVGLQVVLPSDAVNYGLARVIQQSLIFLALPAVLASIWVLSKLRLPRLWRPRVVAVGLTLFFLIMSGFLTTLTGGYKPVLAFSNQGFYYEAYYTHKDEIAADQWLATNAPKGSRVYADEFSRRKLITYANIFAQPTLVPAAIPIDSYVYLSNGNTIFNEVPAYYKGDLFFYNVPYDFLNTQKNLLYNGGNVKIYK
jgi:uncharacterized membrane protein